MSKSDYLELELLKWCTGQTNALGTAPTPYLALFTVAPTDAGGGTEVSGGAYARHSSAGKWGAPAAGSVTNNAICAFPTATADWGTVVAAGLFDASTAGNLLRWATLASSRVIQTDDTFQFGVGKITFTED